MRCDQSVAVIGWGPETYSHPADFCRGPGENVTLHMLTHWRHPILGGRRVAFRTGPRAGSPGGKPRMTDAVTLEFGQRVWSSALVPRSQFKPGARAKSFLAAKSFWRAKSFQRAGTATPREQTAKERCQATEKRCTTAKERCQAIPERRGTAKDSRKAIQERQDPCCGGAVPIRRWKRRPSGPCSPIVARGIQAPRLALLPAEARFSADFLVKPPECSPAGRGPGRNRQGFLQIRRARGAGPASAYPATRASSASISCSRPCTAVSRGPPPRCAR